MPASCDCSITCYDMPVFSSVTWRKARKKHVCCECGEEILPGALYEHVSGKWERSMDTYATCRPCASIREDFCPGGWIYGDLWEMLGECLGLDRDEDGGEDGEHG